MKYSTLLAAALFGSVSFAGAASAVAIDGNGTGQFSNISGCSTSFPFPGCSITGGGTVLDMSGNNNSTLTANAIPFAFNPISGTPVNDGIIGQITWVNNPSTGSDQNFNVNYTFTLDFTVPNLPADSQTFTLNILQPTNPPGDSVLNLDNGTLSGLGPFALGSVTMSDLHFSTNGAGGSTYNSSTGQWNNPESNTSILYITADFTAAAVPEPISMSLLGAGLVGLGLVRRKRA